MFFLVKNLTKRTAFCCFKDKRSLHLQPKTETNMAKKDSLTFDVLIEIPKGSRNKYEYDFALHKIRFDRTLFSSMMYPGDYGFVPETLALDQDPLDVLVLSTEPSYPMVVMEVRPIGVFHMTDEKGPDEKIICVPVSDPVWSHRSDITDLNPQGNRALFSGLQRFRREKSRRWRLGQC